MKAPDISLTAREQLILDRLLDWHETSQHTQSILGVHSSKWPPEMRAHNVLLWDGYFRRDAVRAARIIELDTEAHHG